jgi:hypothetical protein
MPQIGLTSCGTSFGDIIQLRKTFKIQVLHHRKHCHYTDQPIKALFEDFFTTNVSKLYRVWWLMNNELERTWKRLLSYLSNIVTFAWRDWENPQENTKDSLCPSRSSSSSSSWFRANTLCSETHPEHADTLSGQITECSFNVRTVGCTAVLKWLIAAYPIRHYMSSVFESASWKDQIKK